jgi:TolB-like protein
MRKFFHFLPFVALLPLAAGPACCQNVESGNASGGTTYLVSPDRQSPEQPPPNQSSEDQSSLDLAAPLTIAVADFTGPDPTTGKFIAESLLSDLSQSKLLQFVERSALKQALTELKLQDSGLVDPEKAKELGKLVSADSMIVGSYFIQGGQLIINARLVDLATGRIMIGSGANASGNFRNVLPVVHQLAHLLHQNITGKDFAISGELENVRSPAPLGDNTLRPAPFRTATSETNPGSYLVPEGGDVPPQPAAPAVDTSLIPAPYEAFPAYPAYPLYGPSVGVAVGPVGPARVYRAAPLAYPAFRTYSRPVYRPNGFVYRPRVRTGFVFRGRAGRVRR